MKIKATVTFKLEYDVPDRVNENIASENPDVQLAYELTMKDVKSREMQELESNPLNFILPGIQPDSVTVEIE